STGGGLWVRRTFPDIRKLVYGPSPTLRLRHCCRYSFGSPRLSENDSNPGGPSMRHLRGAPVSRTRSSRACPAGTFANFGFKRNTGFMCLPVSFWFGSSLRSKLRIQANFRTATLALAAAMMVATPAFADDWPSRPVRMVNTFAAGGTADVLTRMAADHLSS